MILSSTPKLLEIVLDYLPELEISSFSPTQMEIDASANLSVVGISLDRVTAVSWNGIPLSFTAPTPQAMTVSIANLSTSGSYPLYFQSPTLNIYSGSNLTVYVSQFGVPPTLSQRLRLGKFLSRLGFVKYSAK